MCLAVCTETATHPTPPDSRPNLWLRRCGPHGFNTLILQPPGGVLLLALVLQSSPALLLVRIMRQDIFEATDGIASFQSAGQLTPQVSIVHGVHEVRHDLLDLPLQVFGDWHITALSIA